MAKIISLGMINCDIPLYKVPDKVKDYEVTRVQAQPFLVGGDALNAAIASSKLGLKVRMIGRIGDDPHGLGAVAKLREHGVDTSFVIKDPHDVTSTSCQLIFEDGSHSFVYYSTTIENLCAQDVPDEAFEDASAIYFGSALTFPKMDEGGLADVFGRARRRGLVTVMDAALRGDEEPGSGPAMFEKLRGAFAVTDIFFPSHTEAEYLAGQTEPRRIAECFADTGIKIFGIKLGGDGCYVTDFRSQYWFGSYRVSRVVDTVGAGDSFMGGILAAAVRGAGLVDMIETASASAFFCIQEVGATAGVPGPETLRAFLKDNRLEYHRTDF